MSWLCSRALVEAFWVDCSLGGGPSAPLNMQAIPDAYFYNAKTTTYSSLSQYGMTFAPLMAWSGEALLTWFLAASRAKRSAPPPEGLTTRKTFGRKCGESWQMSLPGVSLPRTSRKGQLTTPETTSKRWVTARKLLPFPRRTWVLTTYGTDIGYLHTPTATGNYCAPSMQKHACARAYRRVFGQVTPESHEWLMGWPQGWTESAPLETDKFHSWRQSHFLNSLDQSKELAA